MIVSSVSTDKVSHFEALILDHPCASHQWFDKMVAEEIAPSKLVSLLVNYDAHASLLRRLLLQVATLMPEPAVGFILENVRAEYGSGDYSNAHQLQLFDLINQTCRKFGVELSDSVRQIKPGVQQYIEEIGTFYSPDEQLLEELDVPSIAAGAVTATELLAMKEFVAMQKAFARYDLGQHRWFDHVNVEMDHAQESLSLVEFFINSDPRTIESIEFGVGGVLMCNTSLYDGFYSAIS